MEFQLKSEYSFHLKCHQNNDLIKINQDIVNYNDTNSESQKNKIQIRNEFDRAELIPITEICFGLYAI